MLTSVNATWPIRIDLFICLPKTNGMPSVAFLLCETCVICLYYILCLLWIGYTPLITFSITFHTQTHSEFPPVSASKDCWAWYWIRECIHVRLSVMIPFYYVIWPENMELMLCTANALIVSVRSYVDKQQGTIGQNVTNSSYQRYFNIPLVNGAYLKDLHITINSCPFCWRILINI